MASSPSLDSYKTLIEAERALCLASLHAHIEIACLKEFDPLVHYDVIDALERGDWYEAIVMLPRGHFKSTLIACYLTWRIAKDRNFTCLVVGAVHKTAKDSINFVKVLLEGKRMQEIYGRFEGDSIWNTGELVVVGRDDADADRASTMFGMGMESFKPGGHYNLVWFDDVEDNDTVNTTDLIMKTRQNHTYALPMADKPDSKRITSGTFYSDSDLYSHKIEKFGLGTIDDKEGILVCANGARSKHRRQRIVFFKPAWDENEVPLFPARFSIEDLKELQAEMEFTTPGSFDKQYLLNPVTSKSARFRPEDYVTAPAAPRIDLDVAFGMDSAQSKSEGSDRTGLVGTFNTADYMFYVFETSELALDAEAQQDAIFERHQVFPRARFYVEQDNFVAGWRPHFEVRCRQMGIFPLVEWIPSGNRNKKDDRIFATESLFRMKRVAFLPGTNILWSQLRRMPASRRKDVADAWANIVQFVVPSLIPEAAPERKMRGYEKILYANSAAPWSEGSNPDAPFQNTKGSEVPWQAS